MDIHEEARSYGIFKNFPSIGILTYTEVLGMECVGYEEPIPAFDWQLEEGDSIVAGYPCRKATTTFRGNTWTVWYSLELPYDNGPWKLGGLPGLILHATTADGNFIFNCSSVGKGKNLKLRILDSYKNWTREQLEKRAILNAENDLLTIVRSLGLDPSNLKAFDEEGDKKLHNIETPLRLEYLDKKTKE